MLDGPVFCTVQVTVTTLPAQTAVGGAGATWTDSTWRNPGWTI